MSNYNLDTRVYPLDDPKGTTLAFASVGVDDLIAIRGIRVVDGEKGLFVSMPQSQDKNGEYHDVAFPLNGDLRRDITDAVLDAYNFEMGRDSREQEQQQSRNQSRNQGQRRSVNDRMNEGKERAARHKAPQNRSAAKGRSSNLEMG
jgi:stage V sporulation protein G